MAKEIKLNMIQKTGIKLIEIGWNLNNIRNHKIEFNIDNWDVVITQENFSSKEIVIIINDNIGEYVFNEKYDNKVFEETILNTIFENGIVFKEYING